MRYLLSGRLFFFYHLRKLSEDCSANVVNLFEYILFLCLCRFQFANLQLSHRVSPILGDPRVLFDLLNTETFFRIFSKNLLDQILHFICYLKRHLLAFYGSVSWLVVLNFSEQLRYQSCFKRVALVGHKV